MDLVLEEEGGSNRFIILCPEVDEEGSAVIVDRIKTVMQQAGISVHCGTSTFPDDALTFEGLVNQAKTKLPPPGDIDSETIPELDIYPVS